MQATGRTFDPPESGPFILEFGATKIVILWCDLAAQTHGFLYIKNSFKRDAFKSGALVPMTLGHRISATDNRKNALKSEKTLPKHVLANGYPRDSTRVILRQFWAQRSYRVCVSLKCAPIGKSEPKIAWSPLRCMFLKASEKQLPKRCHGSRDMAIFWSKIV